MKFTKYVIRRLLQMIPVILVVTMLNFIIINLAPGDPVTVLAGELASKEYMDQLRESYGLNQPVSKRLIIYISKLVQGDFGISYSYRQPVINIVKEKMKVTLMLVLVSEIAAIMMGTFLGLVAARRQNAPLDHLITNGSMVLYCIPVFWLGMLLILLFAVNLRWLPSSGMYSFGMAKYSRTVDLLRHLLMPSLALFLVHIPAYIKISRSSVLEVAQEDYITTAYAIGYSERTVYFKHALRNALLPTVTLAGMSLSTVFSGALLTETVFSWPGMGRMIYDGVASRDYPLIMSGFFVTTIMVVIGSFVTDMLYMFLDPRVVHN